MLRACPLYHLLHVTVRCDQIWRTMSFTSQWYSVTNCARPLSAARRRASSTRAALLSTPIPWHRNREHACTHTRASHDTARHDRNENFEETGQRAR
eukprot:1176346-Prorocentrum_minimum.AAC.6